MNPINKHIIILKIIYVILKFIFSCALVVLFIYEMYLYDTNKYIILLITIFTITFVFILLINIFVIFIVIGSIIE